MKVKKCLALSIMFWVAGSGIGNIKTGYGYVENVYILPSKTLFGAKLDTGAGVSSVSAANIRVYEKEGKKHVSFDVAHEAIEEGKRNKDKVEKIAYDLPLQRMMNIKNRAGEDKEGQYDARPVVEMPICFDGKIYNIEVNLTDRMDFEYPVLLGRKTLIQLGAVVDPGQKFTLDDSACIQLFEKMANQSQAQDDKESRTDVKVDKASVGAELDKKSDNDQKTGKSDHGKVIVTGK